MGTNPTNADSNGNGVPDGQEIYTTFSATTAAGASFELTGLGDVAKESEVRDLSDDVRFQQLAGQVSSAVRLSAQVTPTNVLVKLPYTASSIPITNTAYLEILRFDEENVRYEQMGQTGSNGTHVWTNSTEDGIYVLIHMPRWEAHWANTTQTFQAAMASMTLLEDTDNDGLLDAAELFGFPKSDGTFVHTDPNLWDSDGDGLSDGEEIGELITSD